MQNRPAAPVQNTFDLLNLILDSPDAMETVRSLTPPVLQRLINQIGLESSGELIALASPGQLVQLFDTDLWRSATPGQPEQFDAERFGLWLQVMLDLGEHMAAQMILDMDPEFVAMAFSKHLLALNADFLKRRISDPESDEDRMLDKILESNFYHQFPDDWVISKNDASWNALLGILVELENRHQEFFQNVMKRLNRIAAEQLSEHRDLMALLTLEEQLDSDVAEAREMRREQAGFATPLQAAQFLDQARQPGPKLQPLPGIKVQQPNAPGLPGRPFTRSTPKAFSWIQQLRAAQPEAAGEATTTQPVPHDSPEATEAAWPIRRALANLAQENPGSHESRLAELAHLANLLMAGCHFQGRSFRPAEAALAAVATANLGLESLPPKKVSILPGQILTQHTITELFCLGWSRLYEEVCLHTARGLERILASPPKLSSRVKDKAWIYRQWELLRKDLGQSLKTGKPWLVLDQLLILETLWDAGEVKRLLNLLDECPTRQAASSAEPVFFHAADELEELRRYVDALDTQFQNIRPRPGAQPQR